MLKKRRVVIKKCIVNKQINFCDYLKCLTSHCVVSKSQLCITLKKYGLYTAEEKE